MAQSSGGTGLSQPGAVKALDRKNPDPLGLKSIFPQMGGGGGGRGGGAPLDLPLPSLSAQ